MFGADQQIPHAGGSYKVAENRRPQPGPTNGACRMTTNQQSEYRAFLLDNNDRIVRRFDFEADDHDAALKHAKQYVDGHDVEVWQRTHVVGRLKRNK